jgi:hypothetical protein
MHIGRLDCALLPAQSAAIEGDSDQLAKWTLWNHKVLDCHLAQIVRIAHACTGSFDDTLSDDFVYWIVAVADMESQ